MRTSILRLLPAFFVVVAMAAGCATEGNTTLADKTCPSKWVVAGNNGAKADRYYQPDCQ